LQNIIENAPVSIVGAIAAVNLASVATLLISVLTTVGANLTADTVGSIFRIIGIIPFKRRRGFVYQIKSGEPVQLAVLNFKQNGKTITSIVTDLSGAYYEPYLGKGDYEIEAKHPNNSFPTANERPVHLRMYDFYKGETVDVLNSKDQQAIIIPMDSIKSKAVKQKGISWNKVSFFFNRIAVLLQYTVYPMFILAWYVTVISPNVLNLVVAGIYTVLILFRVKDLFKTPTLRGQLIDKTNRSAVKNAYVILKSNGKIVAIEKTNRFGEYKFFVPEGTYTLHVSADKYSVSEGFGDIIQMKIGEEGTKRYNIYANPTV